MIDVIVGAGNYLYRGCRGGALRSKKSAVWIIRHSHCGKIISKSGEVFIGGIRFPEHCIGKRVRVKVEFVDEPLKSMDKNRKLVEPVSFEVTNY